MVQRAAASKTPARTGRPTTLKRAEQQRAQDTRAVILNAALSEFASKGYEGASIRSISDRIGLQHPLITYHFRSKDILWQAVAEHVFERIRENWEARLAETQPTSAAERVQLVYRTLFRFTVDYPEFHRFMLQEFLCYSPRLQWVADNVLKPLIGWLLPQIQTAQDDGALPAIEPIIFHYLLISLTSTLSGFGPEMQATANLSPSDPKVVETYWKAVEDLIFKKPAALRDTGETPSRAADASKPPRAAARSKRTA